MTGGHWLAAFERETGGPRRVRARLARAAENRRLADQIIAGQPPDPILIVGLPRTGSTHLHELLALVDGWRAPTVAEARWPFGYPAEARAETERMLSLTYRACPGLLAIHPMRADGPEELRVLLEPAYMTHAWPMQWPAPRYAARLDTADFTAAWQLVGRILGHLDDGRRWVLKDVAHGQHIAAFLRVFPRAQVIWCHRDPARSLGSVLSLMSATYGRPVTTAEATFMLAKLTGDLRALHRTLRCHAGVIHVDLDELTADPVAVVERIAGPTTAPIRSWARTHPAGEHTYQLADYGLDRDAVEYAFAGLR